MDAGDVLARRYRLDDLLAESDAGRFWRGWDQVLSRPVAIHVMGSDHPESHRMIDAARASAGLHDARILRVLDAADHDGVSYVVNEWGAGASLDHLLAAEGPMQPRRAAYLVSEVADTVAAAHEAGLAHGRLAPENVLVDRLGQVKIIGFAVDAAIHGLPDGRTHADVVDLVGLLYAALTGRWAGMSPSEVPAAPLENGVVLRPRRVRAGIPRMLDALCDQVLNPYAAGQHRGDHDHGSARGIADELAAFVGDPTGLLPPADLTPGTAGTSGTSGPPGTAGTSGTADEPEATESPAGPTGTSDPDATRVEPTVAPAGNAGAGELPTEAGLPVFHDDSDHVGWVAKEKRVPAPPPPFEQPPERPLFAPTPEDGRPVRRPRRDVPIRTTPEWAQDEWGSTTGGSGIGGVPPYPGEEPEVPGRSWLRLAMIVGLCTLVLVAAVAAYQLGGGLSLPDDDPTDSPSPAVTEEPVVFKRLSADDFDPQGDPPEENGDEAPLVVDGDEATTWGTSTYNDQLGPPPGLKTGVGVVVDLRAVRDVSQVAVTVLGGVTGVSVFVSEERPVSVEDADPVGVEQASGTLELVLDEPARGRYVTVWLTSLPAVDGGFRGEIAEITVAG